VDEECLHLWTIKDAKDGDVLAWNDSKWVAIFKNIYNEEYFGSYGFIGYSIDAFTSGPSYHNIEGAHPSTKEERDLLFSKMYEAGYEWDEKKKKLKKIVPKFKVHDCIINKYNFNVNNGYISCFGKEEN
jgi:hypothetical protein